jgi:hypothetical protein
MKFFGLSRGPIKKIRGNKTKQKKVETNKDRIYTEICLIWKR